MKIRIVQSKTDAKEAESWLVDSILIANDIETIPDMRLMTVNGYSGLHPNGEIRSFVFPLYSGFSPASGTPLELDSYIYAMERINASGIPFTFHNGPYDLYWLVAYQLPVANYAYDSMTMFWSIWPELPKTLDFVSSIVLDDHRYWKNQRKSNDYYKYLLYNGIDCDRTLRITCKLVEMLSRNPAAARNFAEAHMRVLLALGMSMRGMATSQERFDYHEANLRKAADESLARLRYLVADDAFNPNSPKQKHELLYKHLGVRPRNAKGRFVKNGNDASTGALPLRAMRSEHPVFRRVAQGILDSMEPAKQISNVIKIKRPPSGRFYTAYNATGTITSRFSAQETPLSYGTNGQNLRKTYRDVLIADPGCFLVDIDFSAGDDVFVTFESGDPRKIELFRSGKDSHAFNSTLFFPNWNYEDVVEGKRAGEARIVHPITGIRQITKKLGHGCNYLMAALTLLMTAGREAIVAAAKEVGFENAGYWTQEQLAEFCLSREALYRDYYTRFARTGPNSFYSDLRRELIETGGFTTPFHYFERFIGDPHDDGTLRGVAATSGQGGTAGRINAAMEEMVFGYISPTFRDSENPHYGVDPCRVSERECGIGLRLQTHDSLTFNVNPEHPDWREGIRRINEVMTRPVVIKDKLTDHLEEFVVGTEWEVGYAWGKGLVEVKKPSAETIEAALSGLTPYHN